LWQQLNGQNTEGSAAGALQALWHGEDTDNRAVMLKADVNQFTPLQVFREEESEGHLDMFGERRIRKAIKLSLGATKEIS
jgi:hypothetical protein